MERTINNRVESGLYQFLHSPKAGAAVLNAPQISDCLTRSVQDWDNVSIFVALTFKSCHLSLFSCLTPTRQTEQAFSCCSSKGRPKGSDTDPSLVTLHFPLVRIYIGKSLEKPNVQMHGAYFQYAQLYFLVNGYNYF